jgi:hypothetical protein
MLPKFSVIRLEAFINLGAKAFTRDLGAKAFTKNLRRL